MKIRSVRHYERIDNRRRKMKGRSKRRLIKYCAALSEYDKIRYPVEWEDRLNFKT